MPGWTVLNGSVLLVLPTLGRGGAERVFVDLAGGLAERGHDVHLAWGGGVGELSGAISSDVTTHDLRSSRTATAVPALRRLVDDLEPSVVLSALFHGNLLAAGAVRCRRHRPALVFTEHVELGTLPRTAPRRLIRWSPALVPVVYRLADAVVAVSEGVAGDLRSVGRLPASLVHHIPNPVDLDRIERLAAEPPTHEWLIGDRSESVIVAVGRLVSVKGFDVLLEALAEMDRPSRLLVVGEGPEREALRSTARTLGVADRVDLPGAVDNPYPFLRAADVVVSSSRTEALPTVLIEALHLRRPVVATDCSAGVRAVVDDGDLGRLVAPDDPTALARAIDEVLAPGVSTEVPAGAMAGYDSSTVVSSYEALMRTVVSGQR